MDNNESKINELEIKITGHKDSIRRNQERLAECTSIISSNRITMCIELDQYRLSCDQLELSKLKSNL